MADTPTVPELAPTKLLVTALPSNRLSIAHLLLWIFVCAVLFSLHANDLTDALAISDPKNHPDEDREFLKRVAQMSTLQSITLWAAIPFWGVAGGSFLLCCWRSLRRQGGLPSQPGHWVLLALGIFLLLHQCWPLVSPFMVSDEKTILAIMRVKSRLFFIVSFCPCVVLAIGTVFIQKPVYWKFVLGFSCAAVCLHCGTWISHSVFGVPLFSPAQRFGVFVSQMAILTAAIGISAAVTVDCWSKTRYDYLHFASAPVVVVLLIEQLVWHFSVYLVMP